MGHALAALVALFQSLKLGSPCHVGGTHPCLGRWSAHVWGQQQVPSSHPSGSPPGSSKTLAKSPAKQMCIAACFIELACTSAIKANHRVKPRPPTLKSITGTRGCAVRRVPMGFRARKRTVQSPEWRICVWEGRKRCLGQPGSLIQCFSNPWAQPACLLTPNPQNLRTLPAAPWSM